MANTSGSRPYNPGAITEQETQAKCAISTADSVQSHPAANTGCPESLHSTVTHRKTRNYADELVGLIGKRY